MFLEFFMKALRLFVHVPACGLIEVIYNLMRRVASSVICWSRFAFTIQLMVYYHQCTVFSTVFI